MTRRRTVHSVAFMRRRNARTVVQLRRRNVRSVAQLLRRTARVVPQLRRPTVSLRQCNVVRVVASIVSSVSARNKSYHCAIVLLLSGC